MPDFNLRPGQQAAYFPDVQSIERDWSADARFVCNRCGGLTLFHDRGFGMAGDSPGCLLCDTERPQYGPEILEKMVELGKLRERVKSLEVGLSTCDCDNCKNARRFLAKV